MKVLVTGGAGFIGSAVCRHLVEESNDEVVVVDSFTYAANPASLKPLEGHPRFRIVRQDVGDLSAVLSLVASERPDVILHLAAESHVDRSITASVPFIRTNIVGTYAMLEAARFHWSKLTGEAHNAFRFVQVSTDEVYGSLGETGLFSENSPYDPSSPYSASKAAADHLAMAWRRTYGLPVIVSNCSNNYGPRQFPEKLIPLALLNALEGKPVDVYGNGLNVRDWLHVEDHARALDLILRRGRPGERYNIGARCERRNIETVQMLCDRLDVVAPKLARPRRDLVRLVPDRPGHDRRYAIDPTKIETELGWRPRFSFDVGLAATVDWYLANREWWGPLRGA